MGDYVTVRGLRTYYDVYGDQSSDPIVLLHGGVVSGSSWRSQIGPLAERYRVFVPDRRGHGRTQDLDGPISFDGMADDTVAFLDAVVGRPADLVGWSDGGIVGLLVALHHPELVRKLVVIGANFHYDGAVLSIEDAGLTADSPAFAEERAAYATLSPDGADHWPVVFTKIMRMWREEPTLTVEDIARIAAPTLVLVGDDDLISLGHTTALYEALPHGQLAVVPAASHAVIWERPELVNELILGFLAGGEPETFMPIRRAVQQEA